ncbi:MAG: ATP-binding protein, partial [Candidatus Binatia bacterium]
MPWIRRLLEAPIARLARQRPVVVLTGARQAGKTSLVRRVFPAHSFVSLDLPSEAEQAEKDPVGFLQRHPPPVIIDEVQYAPQVFRHLKAVVDAERQRNGRFILTGSQKLTLMAAVAESLAGRAAVLELEGLSFEEVLAADRHVTPEAFAARGTLPELWAKRDLDAPEFWRSYVATYLERDLRSLLAVSSLRDYERFVRACALRSAQLLNKAELARDVGISPSTAGQWLSLLEASNQVFLLEPWFSNRTKSLVKTPKLYLCDPGLLCYLVGVRSERELRESPLAAAVWETLVCAELRRRLRHQTRERDLFFWRDRVKEVDFLVHRGGRFEIYEAKWTERPD